MIIYLGDLPPSVLRSIPLSLRLGKTELNVEDLPYSIQTKVFKYISQHQSDSFVDIKTIDLVPYVSVHNDLKSLSTIRETVIEYLTNYLKISTGSYPFDPSVGTNFKRLLHTKDTAIQGFFISNELSNIVRVLSESFGSSILITNASTSSTDSGGATTYFLDLEIKINDIVSNLSIASSEV